MYLREFDRNGNAEISVSVDEVNSLCNALCEYFSLTDVKDKRLYEVRRKLYIIYEVIHHGGCFDDVTLRILEKMRYPEDK